MAFKDVINNYANGATGEITTLTGEIVSYTVSGNAATVNHSTAFYQDSAQVFGDGSNSIAVTFDTPVVGASLTLTGSNNSEKYLVKVDGEVVDLNALVARGDATFSNIGTSATHKINDDGSLSGGYHTDGSIGQVTFHVPVSSIGVTGGNTGGWDAVEIGIDDTAFDTICFAGEAGLRGAQGDLRADRVRAGDRLWTKTQGLQPVRWVGARKVTAAQLAAYPHLRPIRIAPGALGHGLPRRALRLSRQHRMLIASTIVERVAAVPSALVPVFRLIGLPGITMENTLRPVTYIHVLLDSHAVLEAEGAPAESLMPGPMARRALPCDARAEVDALRASTPYTSPHPMPRPAQQKAIVRRHDKNAQLLLKTYTTA